MKKLFMASIFLTTFAIGIAVFQMTSCNKVGAQTTSQATCDVRGLYSGFSMDSTGVPSPITYDLRYNNFAVGSVTPKGPAVTFGGYRNTCDSIFLSVYYTTNSSYYLLKGRLLSDGTTISGIFENLTDTSNHGTFSISK